MKIIRLTLLCLLGISSSCIHANDSGLAVGESLPSLMVTDDQGQRFDLANFVNTGTVVIFFYPKAHTGGCTKQACSLRDGSETLREQGIRVLGISSDSVEDQASFREKHSLPYPLIADTDQRVAKAFKKANGHAKPTYLKKVRWYGAT